MIHYLIIITEDVILFLLSCDFCDLAFRSNNIGYFLFYSNNNLPGKTIIMCNTTTSSSVVV